MYLHGRKKRENFTFSQGEGLVYINKIFFSAKCHLLSEGVRHIEHFPEGEKSTFDIISNHFNLKLMVLCKLGQVAMMILMTTMMAMVMMTLV